MYFICVCASEFVRGFAHVCGCVFMRVACAAVGGGLFIMLCMSPPAKPLLSQHRAPAAPVLAVTVPRSHGSSYSVFCSSRTVY